jgi:hypothetical protein
VIGGQHIASAVKKLFDHLVKEKGIKVDKIDEGIKYVQAEILKPNTPIQIAKYAAGLNQQGQMAGRDCTTEDVVEALIERIHRKRKTGDKSHLSKLEIFGVVQMMGLAKVPKEAPSGKGPDELEQWMVCPW